MPPLRRYVRISPYSVLEVRIFLENPADIPRWLLSPTSPALPRVFAAVRPLILPKLREERERTALTKGKGKKGKSVKDVVEGDGFRVVVFLTEGTGRHEIAVKRKTAREGLGGLAGKGKGMAGGSRADAVVIREEEDEDGDVDLADIPVADAEDEDTEITSSRRKRGSARAKQDTDEDEDEVYAFQDDKKKLGFDTRYEGFSIWGKVLCLLVERKGGGVKKLNADGNGNEGAQKVMQEWISSTQVGVEDEDG